MSSAETSLEERTARLARRAGAKIYKDQVKTPVKSRFVWERGDLEVIKTREKLP